MSPPAFSVGELRRLLDEFLEIVPERLMRHDPTRPIGIALLRLGLGERLASRFSVALVGAMKAGKSTLANALVGVALSPMGVTETTATINRLRYAPAAECGKVRVHWRDGRQADLPLDQVADFVAGSERAAATRFLELFAPAEFLQRVELIDTPGFGSIDARQDALARAVVTDAESLEWGGRADALICVLTPEAVGQRDTDTDDLLAAFGAGSRLAGASPANSIAVVQKWDLSGPDPFAARDRLVADIRERLTGQVSEVLAVSGLLGLACLTTPPAIWADLVALARALPPDARDETIDELLADPSLFTDDLPDLAVPPAGREALQRALPWPVLCFALRHAARYAPADGPALSRALWQAAGIERLRAVLEQRFYAVADMVRGGTILRQTRDPCRRALLELRAGRERQQALLAARDRRVQERVAGGGPADDLLPWREEARSALDDLAQSERIVDASLHALETACADLDEDLECLSLLAALPARALAEPERAELRRLFGAGGMQAAERLGQDLDPRPAALAAAEARLDHWRRRRRSGGADERRLAEHAGRRYEQLAELLEN